MTPPPRHQFYGRRKGKPLRRQHMELLRTLLPGISVDLADPLRDAKQHCWLEIGFGGGEHLAHQAELHPDVLVIGAEAFLNGVAKLLALVSAKSLGNIRIHHGDARDLLDALPDGRVERIYLLYPDPWPKERQKKRRFVNAGNLAQFHRVLQPGGLFLFASDIGEYVDWTLDEVARHGGFDVSNNSTAPFEDWTRTRYEAKAIREGRTPRYLTFRAVSGKLPD